MTKSEFLNGLDARLSALSLSDREQSLEYYAEMIDDRIEDGMSEADAVADIGRPDAIARRILLEMPLTALTSPIKKTARSPLTYVLIVLGTPIWGSLLIAAAAILIALYAVVVSLFVSYCAVGIALFAGAIAGIYGTVSFAVHGKPAQAMAMLGAGGVCAGLGLLMCFGLKPIWRFAVKLCGMPIRFIRNYFAKRRMSK